MLPTSCPVPATTASATIVAEGPASAPHGGYGALSEEVETVMRDWPVPSISPVAGTPLAGFTMAHLNSQVFDHVGKPARFPPWRWEQLFNYYLYLGPRATLRRSSLASSYEPEFQAELQRRREITSRLPATAPATAKR